MSDREEIIQKLINRLIAYLCAQFQMRRQDSEDVVQESMLILSGDRYKDLNSEADLVPLAFSIVRYKRLEFVKASRRYGELPENFDVVSPDPGAETGLLAEYYDQKAKGWLAWLRTAISRSSEECRRLFEMRLQEMSTREISIALGKKENNVLQIEFRCRNKIRQRLPAGARR